MKEIGELLLRRREQKGISLEEAEMATKINRRYLEALEKGDLTGLPEQVYTVGFLRSYALYLDLSPQPLIEELRRAWEPETGEQPETAIEVYPQHHRRVRYPARSRAGYFVAAGLVCLFLVALLLVMNPAEKRETPANRQPQQQAPAGAVVTPPVAETFDLSISASQGRCWLKVVVDGRPAYEATLLQGEEVSFTASQVVDVMFGDAGAVTVKLNDQTLGPPGDRGQVVRKEFRLPAQP